MAAAAYERSQHLALLDAVGSPHPGQNYLNIPDSLTRFQRDFLPLSPLVDPRGRRIFILETNFPKFLNLQVDKKSSHKRAHTILGEIKAGSFVESDYTFERDRLQSLFWIPDVVTKPDAIYRK